MTTPPESPDKTESPAKHSPTAGRPDWIERPGQLIDNRYVIAVTSGPWTTVGECQHALQTAVRTAVDRYVDDYVGDGASRIVRLSDSDINQHINRAQYAEVVHRSVGPMHQLHALLEFDDSVRHTISQRWHEARVAVQLWKTAGIAALIFVFLGTAFGYLKLDGLTGGSYRRRLQWAAAVMILISIGGMWATGWVAPF